MATITRLESLAGVRIPDTPLAKAAVDLMEATSAITVFGVMFLGTSPSEALVARLSTRKLPFAGPFCTTLGSFPPMPAKIALRWTAPTLLESSV